MALKGNDLFITNSAGESHGYVLCTDKKYGDPLLHSKAAPNVGMSNSATPAQAGGLYDVRDYDGDKAISHIDWTLGAGQASLDADGATPYMFRDSSCIDISRPGEMRLGRNIVNTNLSGTAGPIFSALGYLWKGSTTGQLSYSADYGANWVACDGYTATLPMSGWATDGTRLYISFPAGASYSVYANTAADINTFARFGSTGTTSSIRHLCYYGGVLIGATLEKVGVIDSVTGVFASSTAVCSPLFLNQTMTSVALVAAGNAAYWVVSQGAKAFVYQVTLNDDATTMETRQYMEMPSGFVATCAVGYMSRIYIGGYYESGTTGVGRGCVYICSDRESGVLLELGEIPENTVAPSSVENDNRIWAMCPASKDLYFLTNRAIYRWDIDGAGYSHVGDFIGTGSAQLITSWNAGSSYSWDGTNDEGGAPSYQFPSGYTRTTSGTGTAVWDYTGGIAKVTCADGTVTTIATGAPSGGEALVNATGTTMQIVFGPACAGNFWDEYYTGYLRDGTRQMKFSVGITGYAPDSDVTSLALYTWSGSAWCALASALRVTCPQGVSHTVTVTLKGTTATAQLNSLTALSTSLTKATTDASQIVHEMKANSATYPIVCAIDSILLNSVGATPSGVVIDALYRPSIAYCKGTVMAPYVYPTVDQTTGYATLGSAVASTGWLRQSSTNFHTGTLLKNFRSLEIAHDELPAGSTLTASWEIDGAVGNAIGVTTGKKTAFPINATGYSFGNTIILTRDTTATLSPVVRAVNIMWDFVKVPKHQYNLHCASGAKSGRWSEDPETAIQFLYATSDEKATFEDRFVGSYQGVITDVQFLEASESDTEGYSGIMKVLVREDA